MTQRDVEIWLFRPRNTRQSTNEIRRIIRTECGSRGWDFHERQTCPIRLDGRPLGTIDPQDATNLYKRIHRARVGVWQVGYAHAPTNPRPRRNKRDYVSLHRFVRHKAFHHNVHEGRFNDLWHSSLVSFWNWLDRIGCENEADPRCLPFHVFETQFSIDKLETEAGRSEFAQTHGSQSSRNDSNQLRWERPKGQGHGQEILNVSGYNLARGFHWDVSSGKSKRRLTTTSDIWDIGRGGYVNVYPDAYVRGGKSARRVRLRRKEKAR